jgi:predicted SnoaL-like aldol condensation-catalyzing enzyme
MNAGSNRRVDARSCARLSAERNKRAAVEFLELALIEGEPERAVERFVGARYTQHSPGLANGVSPFVEFARELRAGCPGLRLELRRTIADGDLVALHTRVGFGDDEDGASAEHAAVDMYRFDDAGRIVEHWEVIQPVPTASANDNGMF